MMSPSLQTEINRQLEEDFYHYADRDRGPIHIDWSEATHEGHDTNYFGNALENCCGVFVRDSSEKVIAWGWMDFVYAGGDEPLCVFWHHLCLGHPEVDTPDMVPSRGIPQHIWDRLPASTKDRCFGPDIYDAHWRKDPLVLQWAEQRSSQ